MRFILNVIWSRHALTAVVFSALNIGCYGGTLGKPAAAPSLSALHHDPIRRGEQLDTVNVRPDAETQAQKSEKQQMAETVAATAAAIIGSIFSSNPNVLLGWQVGLPTYKENRKTDPDQGDDAEPKDNESPAQGATELPGACLLRLPNRPASCDKDRTSQ